LEKDKKSKDQGKKKMPRMPDCKKAGVITDRSYSPSVIQVPAGSAHS
jgi:hypothetical protein